jgi:hypothetical protein
LVGPAVPGFEPAVAARRENRRCRHDRRHDPALMGSLREVHPDVGDRAASGVDHRVVHRLTD